MPCVYLHIIGGGEKELCLRKSGKKKTNGKTKKRTLKKKNGNPVPHEAFFMLFL
jgi:hypothetical protein